MKIKQAELELVKNLGNYETAKIRLVATITDKENAEESIEKLNTMILKTFAKLYNKKAAPAQTQTQTQTPAPAQEIKRDVSGKIIVEYSKDENSLFQRIKKAVRTRKVDFDEVKKFYSIDKEVFKLLNYYSYNNQKQIKKQNYGTTNFIRIKGD